MATMPAEKLTANQRVTNAIKVAFNANLVAVLKGVTMQRLRFPSDYVIDSLFEQTVTVNQLLTMDYRLHIRKLTFL